jgi:hypothetical protein
MNHPLACATFRDDALYWNLVTETVQYYNEQGAMRSPKTVALFLGSAYRVAAMTSSFPAANQDERIIRLFSWGSGEGGFRDNFYQVNIPGKKYPGLEAIGLRVKSMSVDFGWSGLNESNVEWTYTVATCVQKGVAFPSWINAIIPKDVQVLISQNLVIPSTLKLKKIDLDTAKNAHGIYRDLLKKGVPPEKMKVWVNYKEKSGDDLDSLLIYRWLVEAVRWQRGWRWKTWDKDLYPRLKRAVARYPKG